MKWYDSNVNDSSLNHCFVGQFLAELKFLVQNKCLQWIQKHEIPLVWPFKFYLKQIYFGVFFILHWWNVWRMWLLEAYIAHFLTPECHTDKMIPHMFVRFDEHDIWSGLLSIPSALRWGNIARDERTLMCSWLNSSHTVLTEVITFFSFLAYSGKSRSCAKYKYHKM